MIPVAYAQTAAQIEAQCLVDKVNDAILFPLIALLMAVAFLIFLWGGFEFVRNSDSEAGREKGKTHLLFGVIGMLVMLSAYAILNIAAGTFGLGVPSVDCGNPSARNSIQTSGFSSFGNAPSADTGSGFTSSGGFTDPTVTGGTSPTQPDAPGVDTEMQPSNLLNPNSSDSVPTVDTTSGDPRYEVLNRRDSGDLEISCNNENTCIGAIESCETDHSGVFSGEQVGTSYIICSP